LHEAEEREQEYELTKKNLEEKVKLLSETDKLVQSGRKVAVRTPNVAF